MENIFEGQSIKKDFWWESTFKDIESCSNMQFSCTVIPKYYVEKKAKNLREIVRFSDGNLLWKLELWRIQGI